MIKTSTLFLFISIFLNVHWHLRVFMNQQKLKRNKYPPYHILQFYSWQHMLLFLPKIITDLVFGHSIITHIWSPPLHWCGLCTTTVMWRINDCAWNIHLFRWVSNASMYLAKYGMKWQEEQHISYHTPNCPASYIVRINLQPFASHR